jgi:hypothetical protein
MLQEIKVLVSLCVARVQRSISLKYKQLVGSWMAVQRRKKGAPRNEGISVDVYENKGSKNGCHAFCRCYRNKIVIGISTYVIENKQLRIYFSVLQGRRERTIAVRKHTIARIMPG